MRGSVVLAPVLLGAALIATGAARADARRPQPKVPARVVGKPPPRSFIVQGVMRTSSAGGLAFRVAAEGERQFCAVYDPAEGTPIFLSDGWQTLVYDLANSRVVRVPISRGFVRIEWIRARNGQLISVSACPSSPIARSATRQQLVPHRPLCRRCPFAEARWKGGGLGPVRGRGKQRRS